MSNKSSKYGLLFSHISQGFTDKYVNNTPYYFKHPTHSEYFRIYNKYDFIVESAKKIGLETEQEKIDFAIKSGWWPRKSEDKYHSIKTEIQKLYKTRAKLLLPSQKKAVRSTNTG